MWDHDFPAGIAPAEDEQALPTRHFAPVEDALCFVSYLTMVLGTSNLVGNVTCDTNLTVDDTVASSDLIVTNNAIIGAGIGHDNATLFVLPVS